MMGRMMLIAIIVSLALSAMAAADERLLQWDEGTADVFNFQPLEGHFEEFSTPADWDKTFTQEIMLYCKSYGDVGNLRASLSIWGPQTEGTQQIEEYPDSPVIYFTMQFKVADYITAEAGWVSIPVDTFQLPPAFWISLFTYSNDDSGVLLGLTAESEELTHSASALLRPADDKGTVLTKRTDGRNWMMRVRVRPTLVVSNSLTSADLTGKNFLVNDDGEADGYAVFQRYGPMLHIEGAAARKVKRVYVYGYVEGDWFNTTREAGVYLMNERFQIVGRSELPLARYSSEPGWYYVSFDGVRVPKEHYILLEAYSRPEISLQVGYDTSAANKISHIGTVGNLELGWTLDAPAESETNWMIRVEYE